MPLSTCATVHLARFDSLTSMKGTDVSSTSGDPVAWMVGGEEIGAGGTPGSQEAFLWLAFGLHAEMSSARAVMEAGRTAVPFFETAGEVWSALLQPFSHRGEVNWLDHESPGQVFSVDEPGRERGPFVVITSVGWTIDAQFDPSRVADFVRGVEMVRESMDSVDGLHSRQVFNFPDFIDDAVTVSIWRDDAAMRAFAYRAGEHKSQMDRFRQLRTADRTSFTRFRVLESQGSWNGSDPLGW